VRRRAQSKNRLSCRRRHDNSFLLVAVKRSKLLPFGGTLTDQHLDRLKHTLAAVLAHARTCGQLTFDGDARERYSSIYARLSASQPGMFGAATERAEAHTIRLALIYALLDSSHTIALPHLDAALTVWRYARDSTRWVFGDSRGDPTADDIWALAKERAHGISRTEVRDLFSRNKKARELDRALTALVDAGRLQDLLCHRPTAVNVDASTAPRASQMATGMARTIAAKRPLDARKRDWGSIAPDAVARARRRVRAGISVRWPRRWIRRLRRQRRVARGGHRRRARQR